MLFNCGIGNVTMRCDKCNKLHHSVSVGEETVICSCGTAIAFQEGENYYEYLTVSKRVCKAMQETAYNSDPRNLC